MKKITDEMRARWMLLPDSVFYWDISKAVWVAYELDGIIFSGYPKRTAVDAAVRHWLKQQAQSARGEK